MSYTLIDNDPLFGNAGKAISDDNYNFLSTISKDKFKKNSKLSYRFVETPVSIEIFENNYDNEEDNEEELDIEF